MRRKSRKIRKDSSFRTVSMGVVTLIVCGFMMVMVGWMFDSKCASIQREIGKAEKEYAALELDCVRETARWDEMKTPERLAECLTRFGLEMKIQRQDQVVRMNRDGRPAPGQIAVTRALARSRGMESMASYGGASVKRSSAPSSRAVARSRAQPVRRATQTGVRR